MRLSLPRALAACVSAAILPAAAGDFPNLGALSQSQFRRLSEDLGAAVAYKGVTPATALGITGFDLGIEVTDTKMENSSLFALAGAGNESHLVIPKLHVHKGLMAGLDIGAFVGGAPEIGATVYGAELRYAFLEDGLATPAVAMRLSGSGVSGTGDLRVGTVGLDLTASKRFTLLTPYVGAGVVRVQTSASGTGLAKETFNQGRYFGGVNLNLVALNLAFEAEKMGENLSLSAKFGWRF